MTTQTIVKNEKENIANLQQEIELLRSFVVGIAGKDGEGNYRPEFVRKVLKASKEKGEFIFKNGKSFLSRLRKK
ncbi:MAG: hypothetical protein Q7K28_03430 [Candidatus Wildermuthbacteria bacterium]|nr:hypothetical protein [Candidatus Wildermuthbacteria bacterium]